VGLKVAWLTIDADDPGKLARWWMEALDGYELEYEGPDAETDGEAEAVIKSRSGHRMLFIEVHDEKTTKNRLHLDLRPDDRDVEVARLEGMGATRIDVGQGDDKTWVVMADIEGNEFCVLRALTPEERAQGES